MVLRIVGDPEYSANELKAQVDLRALVAPGKAITGNKPIRIKCLWHEERTPSLVIWPDRMRCFGGSCGKGMDLLDFVAWQEGLDHDGSFEQVLAVTAEKYVGLPGLAPGLAAPPWAPPWVPLPPPLEAPRPRRLVEPMAADVADYLYRHLGDRRVWFYLRGLSDETIDREKLGHSPKAFSIPVWSPQGELLNIRYRRDDDILGHRAKKLPKYWGLAGRNQPMLYNAKALHLVPEWGWVMICEGELDALRLYQEGVPAVSVTNGAGALDDWMAWEIRRRDPGRVIVAYDQDEAGQANARRVARMFGMRGRVMDWPRAWGKDVTEYLKRRSVDEFVERAERAGCPQWLEVHWRRVLKHLGWR